RVYYDYYPKDGAYTGDRLRSISIATQEASGPGFRTLIQNAQWEPYGGLRGYELQAPLAPSLSAGTATVEYLLGDYATMYPPATWATSRPSGGFRTGRLRALWVSSASLSDPETARAGDIFKRTYTWKADQLVQQQTCLLNNSSTSGMRTEGFADASGVRGYD